MVLKISITRPRGQATAPRELTLQSGKATVGRSPDSDVMLDDPERVVSGRHALIEIRDGEVWITDLSRNGTFINQSPEPLPPHQPVALSAADRILIGPYELRARLAGVSPAVGLPRGSREDLVEGLPDFFAPGQTADILDLLGGSSGGGSPKGGSTGGKPRLRDDPFADAAALDSRLAGVAKAAEPQSDHHPTPVEHVCFRPPEPETIPEDYDILRDVWTKPDARPQGQGQAGPPTPWGTTAEGVPEPLLEEIPGAPAPASPASPPHPSPPLGPPPPHRPVPGPRETAMPMPPRASMPAAPRPPVVVSESAILSAFLAGLGITDRVAVEHPQELMHEAGALLRELVAGLVRTLMGRAQFKSELRLGVTTIRPLENNPFKFAADPGDVLDRLLLRPSPGFMPARAAAHEAFDDIRAHEMAMTAGLQAALRALLARFEPAELERRLNGRSRLGHWLPLGRKAHAWDLFTDAYAEVAADAADDFMRLFGDTFAAAYREQIQRLACARDRAPAADPDNT